MILKFIKRTLVFLFPIFLVVVPLEVYLLLTGETLPSELVIEKQLSSKEEIKYQRGLLSQQFNMYKIAGINYIKPEILVIGSSRVMKFRSFLFHPNEDEFYNAGGLLQCVNDLLEFSNLIRENKISKPKTLIIGIDPWWYKKDNNYLKSWLKEKELKDDAYSVSGHFAAYLKLFKLTISGNLPLVNDKLLLGLGAKLQKAGFRKDGSKSLEKKTIESFIENPVYVDRESPPVTDRIRKLKTKRFTYSEIDSTKLDLTLKAIENLKMENIKLIIYFPPFSNESFQALEESESLGEWWNYYKETIYNKIKNQNVTIIKTCSPSRYKLEDVYFIDGMHPSEVFVAIQFLDFFKSDNNSYFSDIEISHLEQMITRKETIPLSFQID